MRQPLTSVGNGTHPLSTADGIDWVCITGNFDSATVVVEAQPIEGAAWVQASDESVFTAAAWHALKLPKGVAYRLNISGGTAPAINAFVS